MTTKIVTAPSMRLLVETTARSMLFAEAKRPRDVPSFQKRKDVVDFLFSIPALPIGASIELLERERMGVGSMGNLHASVMKLDKAYPESSLGKGAVVGNLTATLPVPSKNTLPSHPSPSVRGGVTYTVLDDLTVTPTSAIAGIKLLNTLPIKDLGALQERHVQLMRKEALEILNSLVSKPILTEVYLGEKP